MPPAIPVIATAAVSAAVAGTVAASAAALTLGFSWVAFGGSLILGAISYALTPKPKKGGSDSTPSSGTVSVRQSDMTHSYIYGHTRVTKGYAHMQSTGANGTLHVILILCQGTLRSINEIWANDYSIPSDWIDADGNVTQGRYAGVMTIRKHLGQTTQAADAMAVANMEGWTTAHQLNGIAYLYITMTKNQDIYPTGVPNFSAIVEGIECYDPRVDAPRWSTNIALYACDYLINPIYGYGIFDDDTDYVNIASQANICDEIVTTTNQDTTIASVEPSNDLITLSGDLLKVEFGDQVQIVTSGTPPGGLSTGVNYYVIPYQIKDTPRIGLATNLTNAMAKVYIDITDAGSGTMTLRKNGEPRYHGGGIIETATNLSQNLNDIVSSMAGRAINTGGYWTLLAGAWRAPTLNLGIGDMRGSGIGFKSDLSMSESYNVVKGLFVSPENLYQTSDYPAARYQQFIDDDNGLEAQKDLNLPFTQRPTTAQRIAKIELFRGRQGIGATSDFSMKAFSCQPGDNIEFNVERLGWEDKEFEVTEFNFSVNNGALGVSLGLRETAQEIFDWSSGEAIDFDPAPNTSLPNPFNVVVPTAVAYDSRSVATSDSDTLFIMKLTWALHPDAFVREFGDFEIRFKLSSDVTWLPSFFVDGSLTETDAFSASAGNNYDIGIRARNNLGVRSQWVTIYNAVVGSSGGVTILNDWDFVYNAAGLFNDWGNVADAPTSFEDWEFVV